MKAEATTFTVELNLELIAAIAHLREALVDLVATIPGDHVPECHCPRCAAQHALAATCGFAPSLAEAEPAGPPPASSPATTWANDPTDQ